MKIWALILVLLSVALLAYLKAGLTNEESTTTSPSSETTTPLNATTTTAGESTTEGETVTPETWTTTTPMPETSAVSCGTTCFDVPGCITITDSWYTTCQCTYICDTEQATTMAQETSDLAVTEEEGWFTGTTPASTSITPEWEFNGEFYYGTTCWEVPGCENIYEDWRTSCSCNYICTTTTEEETTL